MVKRSRQTGRPAGRRPGARRSGPARPGHPSPSPSAPPANTLSTVSPSGLTADEEARAAALEAEILAQEQAAERAAAAVRRPRVREAAVDPNVPLSVRAAHEYAYVARDVRRIGLTAGLMVAVLAILHVLINVMGVIKV